MLSNEETLNLLILAQKGDENAKEILITENSPLIKSIIRRFKNKGIEDDDLYQLGSLGFVKAIKNFNPEFNVKFSTYAVPMIAGEIKRFLRDDGSIKVSRSIKRNAGIIKNYIAEHQLVYGVEPTISQISDKLGLEQYDIILSLESSSQISSIDDKLDEDDDSYSDRISDGFSPDKLVDKILIRDMINSLPAREKRVIIMRYYLDKTQAEIAKTLGVSQVQISRIESKILDNFKEIIKR